MKIPSHILPLLLLLAPLPARTEELSTDGFTHPMRSLTIHDGLSGESVYAICRTADGLTWFGTSDGVTCYDGYMTDSYHVGEQPGPNVVSDIEQTVSGTLFAASDNGCYRLMPQEGKFALAHPDLAQKINSLSSQGDTLYVGTSQGLFILTDGNCHHIWLTANHLSKANTVHDVAIDDQGQVWILGNYELYLLQWGQEPLAMGLANQVHLINTMRVLTAANGRIFIGSYNNGLFFFDPAKGEFGQYVDIDCPIITCLSHDRDNLYVGTDGAGVKVISLADDRIMETYSMTNPSYPLLDNSIYSFLRDGQGVMFFGYFHRGVQHNYYVNPIFHCYSTPYFSSAKLNIRSFCIDDHIKVLGLRTGLFLIDENRGISRFFSPREMGGSIVTNVVKYNGQYYCSTYNGGVIRIDPGTLTASRFSDREELLSGSFGSLVVSPDGELWMSGLSGIFIFNSETNDIRCYNAQNSTLPDSYIRCVMFDRQNRGWISTSSGILLYDPLDHTFHSDGFPQDFFKDIHGAGSTRGDKDNLIFFCNEGLFRTDEDLTTFGLIDTRQIIGNVHIRQAIFDRRHHSYWIATERGFFQCDPTFSQVAKFGPEVGLNSNDFSNEAIHIDSHNQLWTGTVDGLFHADLEELHRFDTGESVIVLSDARINAKLLDMGQRERMMVNHEINLTYHWKAEDFSFLPLQLNYSNPAGQCFEFRIVDSEKDETTPWTVLKNREQAEVSTLLRLGNNLLEVRLSGQKHHTDYIIKVRPSGIFIFEITMAIIVIAILTVVWRQRRALKLQREQMEQVKRELEETKKKYSRVQTSKDEQQRLYNLLDNYMRTEKPYKNRDLKLSDIAAHLDASTVKLSQLLNVYLNQNYYDFVNQYRLAEFKRLLTDPEYTNYTLQALADECGFRRSNFFATFRKAEGITPAEYAKRGRQSCINFLKNTNFTVRL